MNNPFFSIITVTKNCAIDIEKTLASVKIQTFTNYEHVVIDGYSSDSTFERILNFKSNKIIKKQIKDTSCYEGFNNALKLINGKFFIFLHSGDFFYSEYTLEKIHNNISHNTDLLYGNCIFFNKIDNVNRVWISSDKNVSKKNFYKIPHTATITNKKIFEKVGFFNLNYKISSDTEYLIKISNVKNLSSKFINEPIVFMKMGGISTSKLNFFKRTREDLYIIINSFDILPGIFIHLKKLFFKFKQLNFFKNNFLYEQKLKELKQKLQKCIELQKNN